MLNDLLQVAVIINVLSATIRISTPLLLAALGELITEKSGILNLGLEGGVLMGAFTGFLVANLTGSMGYATVAAILAGGLMNLILSIMVITFKVNQSVTGLILNLLASGASLFGYRLIYAGVSPSEFPKIEIFHEIPIPILSDIPFLGDVLFSHRWITYVAFLLVPVVALIINRTKPGLILRAIGESPRSVDMHGINVPRFQYIATIIGGMLAGLGGAFITLGSSVKFVPEISGGRGWLAIVIVIAGNWKPFRTLLATLVFAFLSALQLQLQGVGVELPFQVLLAMPYIVAIIVMMGTQAKSASPSALGKPYLRE